MNLNLSSERRELVFTVTLGENCGGHFVEDENV